MLDLEKMVMRLFKRRSSDPNPYPENSCAVSGSDGSCKTTLNPQVEEENGKLHKSSNTI